MFMTLLIVLSITPKSMAFSGDKTRSIVFINQEVNELENYRIDTLPDYQTLKQALEKVTLLEKKAHAQEVLAKIDKLQEIKERKRAIRAAEIKAQRLKAQKERQAQLQIEGGANASKLVQFVSNYTDTQSANYYVDLCIQYGKKYEIDPVWLLAVMKTESTFNRNAVSHAEAKGLMQFLPSTARAYGVNSSQLYDPRISVSLAAEYLNDLRSQTGSMRMAIIAYNQGIGNVKNGTYRTWYYDKVSSNYELLKTRAR